MNEAAASTDREEDETDAANKVLKTEHKPKRNYATSSREKQWKLTVAIEGISCHVQRSNYRWFHEEEELMAS